MVLYCSVCLFCFGLSWYGHLEEKLRVHRLKMLFVDVYRDFFGPQ